MVIKLTNIYETSEDELFRRTWVIVGNRTLQRDFQILQEKYKEMFGLGVWRGYIQKVEPVRSTPNPNS